MGNYLTRCDICGYQMLDSESYVISDPNSIHKGLVVDQKCLDAIGIPLNWKPKTDIPRTNSKIVRGQETMPYIGINTISGIESGVSDSRDTRVPSTPSKLAIKQAESDGVAIFWEGSADNGSSPVYGYKIERESPVAGGFSTLVANTDSVAQYYLDESVSASTQYNYRVSSINREGTSSASNEAAVTTGA